MTNTNETTKTETAITFYVPGHGTFKAPVLTYLRAKRMTRKALITKLLPIYEGARFHGGKGDKASHWTVYSKEDLAIIVADCLGESL